MRDRGGILLPAKQSKRYSRKPDPPFSAGHAQIIILKVFVFNWN